VKVALVTTPWSSRSGIADYCRHLLPYLREGAEVDVFVEVGREGEDGEGESLRSVAELAPREYDQILYQLGNEASHAFMLPMIRALGGTVVLHDWVLFDLAVAAHPELARGGLRGLQRAWREGGAGEARVFLRNRRQVEGTARGERFRAGWYAPEAQGRWSSARAELDPAGAEALRLELLLPEGRELELRDGASSLGSWREAGEERLELELRTPGPLALEVHGAGPREEDRRELGVFLRSACVRHGGRWRELDLAEAPSPAEQGLSADRFELSLNRSVVRHADAFLVHSDWVGERILASRNAPTPIARVHHGIERRWEGARAASRAELGLPAEAASDFLVATFGALQRHKRPGVLLDALARLAELDVDVHLLCVGEERPSDVDFRAQAARVGLADRVQVTGWLPEERAWSALAAADVVVNLRGPSTGGTSGAACQALSLGKAVVLSDLPEFSHLPASCSLRVAPGPGEVEELCSALRRLAGDPALRQDLEQGARRAVEEELHWSHVARRYLEVLESFPRARAARRSIFVRLLHARAEERSAAKEAAST